MYQLTLKCRLITPMFMAGADGRTPELRPSEFKGMMRWWWRAIKAEDDIERLKKEEAKIFGGTGEGEGRSKVVIRTRPNQIPKDFIGENLKKDFGLQWRFIHQTRTLDGNDAGIGYLLYSTVLPNRERPFIKPGFEFELTVISYEEMSFINAVASLWLAINLGGFGTRARRGAGNIEVLEVLGNNKDYKRVLENLNFKCEKRENLAYWLVENVKQVSKIINGKTQPEKFCFSYSNLSFSRFILAKEPKNTWIESLNEIGKIYENFRSANRNKVFSVGAFGLPIVHRQGESLVGEHFSRRASPLIIKLLRADGKFFWMVLRLAGEFLPEGEVLKFGNKKKKTDYSLIDEFWHHLKNFGDEYVLVKPEVLDKIVGKIKTQVKCSKIILFGSRARGDAHKRSDIDIAIETDEPIGNLEFEAPIDIVNLKKVNQAFREKIEKEGVVIL